MTVVDVMIGRTRLNAHVFFRMTTAQDCPPNAVEKHQGGKERTHERFRITEIHTNLPV